MNNDHRVSRSFTGLLLAITIGLWTVGAGAAEDEAASSGYLDATVESKLKDTRLESGRHVDRWVSQDLNGKNYQSVMVDRVIYFPAPNPGPEVSSSTLDSIADHLTNILRDDLDSEGVNVVDKAGPGVLRVQPAFTVVSVKKEGMSAMDIIPIHLLFTAAKHASDSAGFDTKAQLEVRVTDSVSGDYKAAVKMDLKGEKIKKDEKLSLKDVQKVLDKAAADGAKSIHKALK